MREWFLCKAFDRREVSHFEFSSLRAMGHTVKLARRYFEQNVRDTDHSGPIPWKVTFIETQFVHIPQNCHVVTFIKNVLVTFIENCSGDCVIGLFSKITIKPGVSTKPEFCTKGNNRYLTGGQYYQIGAFWQHLAIKKSGIMIILFLTANYTAPVTFLMNDKL